MKEIKEICTMVYDLTESERIKEVEKLRRQINFQLALCNVDEAKIEAWNYYVDLRIYELKERLAFPMTHTQLLEINYYLQMAA